MLCEISDFTFPLLADVYYPIVTQGDLGEVKKQWLIDKTIACSLSSAGLKEEVAPNAACCKGFGVAQGLSRRS